MLPGATTLNGSRTSPGNGEAAALPLPRAGHSTRFSTTFWSRSGYSTATVLPPDRIVWRRRIPQFGGIIYCLDKP